MYSRLCQTTLFESYYLWGYMNFRNKIFSTCVFIILPLVSQVPCGVVGWRTHDTWRSAYDSLRCLFSREQVCAFWDDWTQHSKCLCREKVVPKHFLYDEEETEKKFMTWHDMFEPVGLPFFISRRVGDPW